MLISVEKCNIKRCSLSRTFTLYVSLKWTDDLCTVGELFAQCPLDGYPSAAMEQVLDSSRYFVIRIQDELGWF